MSLIESINKFLALFNSAVVRRSTLDSLVKDRNKLTQLQSEAQRQHINTDDGGLHRCDLEDVRKTILQHQVACKWFTIDHVVRQIEHAREQLECALCGHVGAVESFKLYESYCKFGGGRLERHQCPACDVVFGPEKIMSLSDNELSQEYEWHYQVNSPGDSTEREIETFKLLLPQKNGVYLNYGAGAWSSTVTQLRAEGWKVWAYEPHASATAKNARFVIRDISKLESMKFDGIFSNNVLEHFRHPVHELSYIANLLKPQGRMAHTTPCFEYLCDYTRFHLFFYLGRSRLVLADKANLNIVDFVQDGSFMSLILDKKEV